MSSFARLSAALGTAAVLATAGLGSAYAQSESYDSQNDVTTITTDPQVINHFQTTSLLYSCLPGHLLVPQGTDSAGNLQYYQPTASAGVTSVGSTLGNLSVFGPASVNVTWTNWNLTGDQTFQVDFQCTGNEFPSPPPAVASAPSLVPETIYTDAVSLGDFQSDFSSLLPTLGGGTHTNPSAGLLPSIQTPPNVAALGRHLVREYVTPQTIISDQVITLAVACPSAGLVTADPGVRSALPYISRVTNVNVWSSLASGDVGQS
ncbi:MAG: hypothetical protein JO352_06520 [Chloroflexi bacterium]|nr:hypothetical protein [Chloroflexota bacterium]MBV9601295.1 hypothetical protein [Chloroflexota bacterium]